MSKKEDKQEVKPTMISKLVGELGQKILIGIVMAVLAGGWFWMKDKYEGVTLAPLRITILENKAKQDSAYAFAKFKALTLRVQADSALIHSLKEKITRLDSSRVEHTKYLESDFKNLRNLRQTLNLAPWD